MKINRALIAAWLVASGFTAQISAADKPGSTQVDATGDVPNAVATGIMPVPIYDFAVHAVAFSPDGRTLLAGTGNGLVHLWETDPWHYTASLGAHADWAFALAWFPDGQRFATGGGDNLVRFYRRHESSPHATLTGHTADVHAVAISSDGQTLLSAGDDRKVQLWDVATAAVRATLGEHSRQIPAAAISADNRWAATSSRDGTISLWNLSALKPARVLKGHGKDVMSVKFSPDGHRLASASYDRTVRVWEVDSGTLEQTLEGHTNRVFAVAYSPDGKVLASAGDSSLRLWAASDGKLLRVVQPGTGITTPSGTVAENISSVSFHPGGVLLAVGSTAGMIYIIKVEDGTVVTTLHPPRPHIRAGNNGHRL